MQSKGINWKWTGISIVIFAIIQLGLIILYPLLAVITLGIGILLFGLIKLAGYFLGGFLSGYFSPGITLLEPAIGAVISVVIGSIINFGRHRSSLLMLILVSAVAFALALIGAKLGEKKQAHK